MGKKVVDEDLQPIWGGIQVSSFCFRFFVLVVIALSVGCSFAPGDKSESQSSEQGKIDPGELYRQTHRLYKSLSAGDFGDAREAVELGADVNKDPILSMCFENIDFAKVLLDHGANPFAQGAFHKSIKMDRKPFIDLYWGRLANSSNDDKTKALSDIIELRQEVLLDAFLEQFPDVNAYWTGERSPFAVCSWRTGIKPIVWRLMAANVDPRDKGHAGSSALSAFANDRHDLTVDEHLEFIDWCLEQGASVNGNGEKSPFDRHLSADQNVQAYRMLRAGADLSGAVSSDRTGLETLVAQRQRLGSRDRVKQLTLLKLVLQSGAQEEPNPLDLEGALKVALKERDTTIARILIAYGAEVKDKRTFWSSENRDTYERLRDEDPNEELKKVREEEIDLLTDGFFDGLIAFEERDLYVDIKIERLTPEQKNRLFVEASDREDFAYWMRAGADIHAPVDGHSSVWHFLDRHRFDFALRVHDMGVRLQPDERDIVNRLLFESQSHVEELVELGADRDYVEVRDGGTPTSPIMDALRRHEQHHAVELHNHGFKTHPTERDALAKVYLSLRDYELTNLCLEQGVDPNTRDGNGNSTLYRELIGSRRGHDYQDMIDLLRRYEVRLTEVERDLLGRMIAKGLSFDQIKLFIDVGANLSVRLPDGRGLLIHLLEREKYAAAKLLVERGIETDPEDQEQLDALLCGRLSEASFSQLMQLGANLKSFPMVDRKRVSPLYAQLEARNHALALKYLDMGAAFHESELGRLSPLLDSNREPKLISYLGSMGADPNAFAKENSSSPFWSILPDVEIEEVQAFLDIGADATLTRRNRGCLDALFDGKKLPSLAVVKLLVGQGAKFDNYELTDRMMDFEWTKEADRELLRFILHRGLPLRSDSSNALSRAIYGGRVAVVQELVNFDPTLGRDEDFNVIARALDRLMYGAKPRGNWVRIHDVLQKAGFPKPSDSAIFAAFDRAMYQGSTKNVNFLVDRGYDVNVCVSYGTPLEKAVERGVGTRGNTLKMVRHILARGADPHLRCSVKTPMEIATEKGDYELIAIIKKAE